MSIGINFRGQRSYRSADVNAETQITKYVCDQYECNCGCASGATSGCNCQPPKVWPIPDNPPQRPSVMSRPYPPDFVLPPEAALLSVNKENTEMIVHHLCCKKPIEAYISSYVFKQDYNLSGLLSTYTENYTSSHMRFMGQTPSAITTMYNVLSTDMQYIYGNWELSSLNAYINSKPQRKQFELFLDLHKGDFFYSTASTILTGALSGETILTLIQQYICVSSILSTAKFEQVGSNNILTIQSALIYLNNKIDSEISTTRNDLSGYINSEISSARNDLSAYARETSGTAYERSIIYTNEEIKKLGTVFNIKGFIADTQEFRTVKPYDYLSGLIQYKYYDKFIKCTSGLRAGDIYLVREEEPISGIAEYLFIGKDNLSSTVILSTQWEKLGSNSGYALSTDVKALVEATSAITLLSANIYTNQQINLLESSAAASTIAALLSANIYTEQLVAASTEFAITSAHNYTDQVSTIFANALTGGIIKELSGAMIYKGYAWVDPENYNKFPWIAAKQHPELSTHIYKGYVYLTDVEINNIIETQQFMYIAEDNTSTAISSAWLKLGYTTDLMPTSSFITGLVDITSSKINNVIINTSSLISSMIGTGFDTVNTVKNYTENLITSSAEITYNSGVAYTNNLMSETSTITLISANTYSNYISAAFASTLTGKIAEELSGAMIYKSYACPTHKTETPWEAVINEHINLSSHIYKGYVYIANIQVNSKFEDQQFMYIAEDNTSTAISSAWLKLGYTTDLMPTSSFITGLVDTTSSKIINQISGIISSNLDGTMIYKNLYKSMPPWDFYKLHPQLIDIDIYKGSVFLTSAGIYGTDISGNSMYLGQQLVQYMYYASTQDRQASATIQDAYIKLGYDTNLSAYATVDFVKKSDNILSGKINEIQKILGDLSEKLDTYNNLLNGISKQLDDLQV